MTQVSRERLEEMLAGLGGVTPGPWDTTAGLVRSIDGEEAIPIFESREPWKKHRRTSTVMRQDWHNRQHIARCDPDTMRSILTELLSLRQSHSTGAVGNGWKLVPSEPTEAMCQAGENRHTRVMDNDDPDFETPDEFAVIYKAMIAAAPSLVQKDGEPAYPRCANVRAHKHTCANVQPGSTLADKCDCGALDTAGNSIPLHPKEAEVTVTEEMVERAGVAIWNTLVGEGVRLTKEDVLNYSDAAREALVAALSRKG